MIRITLDPATPGTGAVAIDPPLVAGEPAAVLVTGMAPPAGHEWRLVLSTHCHDRILSATEPLESVTDGYGATLELATRQIAAALALCCADGTITVALELVDATARASLCQTLVPLRNSVLAQGGTGDLPSWSVGVTVEQVEQIVAAALAPYATTAEVAAAIADALAGLRLDRISDADATTVLQARPGSAGATLSLSAPPCAVGHSEDPAATLRTDRPLAELVAGTPLPVRLSLEIAGATHTATATYAMQSATDESDYALRSGTAWLDGALLAAVGGEGNLLVLARLGEGAPATTIVFPSPADEPAAPMSSPVATVRDIPAPPPLGRDAPSADGSASAGTSPYAARADHVHPVDASRMPATATGNTIPMGAGPYPGTIHDSVVAYALGYADAARRRALSYLPISIPAPGATIPILDGYVVYRLDLPATGAIPPLDLTHAAPDLFAFAYLLLELELRVPDPAPASVAAPSGWTFVPDAPLPSSLTSGQVLHLSLRVDGTDATHPVLASCWLVA